MCLLIVFNSFCLGLMPMPCLLFTNNLKLPLMVTMHAGTNDVKTNGRTEKKGKSTITGSKSKHFPFIELLHAQWEIAVSRLLSSYSFLW